MKKFTIALLGAIFVTLITGSIQSISADDLEPGQEFSEDEKTEVVFLTKDSKYKLHVQVIVRNADNQVISVAEAMGGKYVPHKITDNAFDTSMGKKKIVTVDGIKYEKVQFYDSYKNKALWDTGFATGSWIITMCEEKCLNIFQARNVQVVVEGEDVVTVKWTILRDMN
tara:strand:- start:17 stop:523 length:507 start_codon:yes stop_codon:yes gene_type:complete